MLDRHLPIALCFPLLLSACSTAPTETEEPASEEDPTADLEESNPAESPSLSDLIRRTQLGFRESGYGIIEASHATHLVELYGTRIELSPFFPRVPDPSGETPGTPAIPGAAIGLETVAMARGEADLLDEPGAPELGPDGSVTIPRGPVDEHLDNTEVGVEQSWTLHQAPGADGDLVVRIRVDGTQGYVAATDSGLHFEDPISGLGVSYGVATWIDADGVETTAMPSFEDGHIVIRIPDEVVDASSFPVLLDPVISAENGIDNPVLGPAAGNQTMSAIAYGDNQYFAAWYDGRLAQPSIYGTRLSAAGHVLDPAGILIATSGANPDVTFDGTNFVVAWANFEGVRAARVGATGSVLDPGGVALLEAGFPNDAAVAFDGSSLHVVYRHGDDIGRLVLNQDLSVMAVEESFSDGEVFAAPALACNTMGACLLVHQTRLDETRLRTWTAAAPGVGGSTIYGKNAPVAAAPRGTGFVVAARRDFTASSPGQIDVMTVAQNGDVSPPVTAPLSTLVQDISCSESECAVFAGGSSATVLGVDPDSGFTWSASLGDVYPNELASNGSDYMALVRDDSLGQSGDIAARRLGAGFVGQSRLVSTTVANAEASPDVACNGSQCLAVWQDDRAGALQIFGAFTTSTGTPVTGHALHLGCEDTSCADAQHPSVAYAAGRFVTAYECTLEGWYRTLCFTSVEPNGALVYRDAPTGSMYLRRPRLSAGANGQLLAVAETGLDLGTSEILGVLLDVTNGPLSELLISGAIDDQLAPAVAFDGSGYVVAWEDWRRGAAFGPDIMAARVTAGGALLDPQGFNVSVRSSAEARPAIASNGAGSVVVTWEDSRGGSWDIYGARIASGAVSDPNGISFGSPATSQQRRPAMAWNGTSYQVVWEDDRNGSGEIYGRQITTAGAMSGGAFGVVTSTTSASDPQLAGDGAGGSLLVYQRTVPALNQTRVRAKAITP